MALADSGRRLLRINLHQDKLASIEQIEQQLRLT
jgi:hypothetical protein